MLRRLKIGGRVNMLIAVPLLALMALAALGYVSLQSASVRGDEYKALKEAQDLRASSAPPPANLLEAWAEVNHTGIIAATIEGATADGKAEIARHVAVIDAARVKFEESMAYWSKQDLPDRVEIRFVQIGGDAGRKFFQQVDDELKPALERGGAREIIGVIQSMKWRYDLQQSGVDRALTWAEPEVASRESSSDSYVSSVILFAGAGALVLLLLTLMLSVLVRRSIVGPIRRLAAQAKSVAMTDLPQVVQTVQELPADATVPHLAPFDVDARDELADLGASFNSVQDAAVDLAAEQAMARRIVSENLVNIARRNQNLLGRTLGFISTLEQGERNPEALDNLFRLDHLTTRMRRNAQSLLVLAGAEPTRLWSPVVAIGDVVRAALSEVENYGQVELADLGDIGVQGALAPEVAHLLAELLENATSFSPPTTAVTVVGRAVPDGHQLAIFDYGLGMTVEELAAANRRLNQVASFDRESNKMLGFQVVARLAARHDMKVMLTATPGGTGVTAIVRLPNSILETVGAPGKVTSPAMDVQAMAQRLSEPLPIAGSALSSVTAPAAATASEARIETPARALGEAAWDNLKARPVGSQPTDATPNAFAAIVADPSATASPFGELQVLTKRVRGAQLPDLSSTPVEETPPRPAEEVRSTMASLQRGVDLGRQRPGDV